MLFNNCCQFDSQGPSTSNISLDDVEQIEVLKGSAGVLYGSGQPGGTINITTKQPQREPSYQLQSIIGNAAKDTSSNIGAYAQDLLSIGEKVKLVLGGRFDWNFNEAENAVFGLYMKYKREIYKV